MMDLVNKKIVKGLLDDSGKVSILFGGMKANHSPKTSLLYNVVVNRSTCGHTGRVPAVRQSSKLGLAKNP